MFTKKREVSVHKFPRDISSTSQAKLLKSLELFFECGHPRFVLDCSELETVGPQEIHLLLSCLEEAMKYKGDVRLAHVGPQVRAMLERLGVARLFDIFDTSANASSSYQVGKAHRASGAVLEIEHAA